MHIYDSIRTINIITNVLHLFIMRPPHKYYPLIFPHTNHTPLEMKLYNALKN